MLKQLIFALISTVILLILKVDNKSEVPTVTSILNSPTFWILIVGKLFSGSEESLKDFLQKYKLQNSFLKVVSKVREKAKDKEMKEKLVEQSANYA